MAVASACVVSRLLRPRSALVCTTAYTTRSCVAHSAGVPRTVAHQKMEAEDGRVSGGLGGGETPLKILCLHSFRTSAAILRGQLDIAQWPSSLGDLCQFTFMDAPHPASGNIPPDVASFFEPPYFEWWNAMKDENGVLEYVGLDVSFASVDAFVAEHGPFDGVLGFSQGATMTGMLAAMGRAEGKGPFKASASSSSGATSATFALMISGMLARTERAQALYTSAEEEGSPGTPSLHIIGEADTVLPPALSERAAALSFWGSNRADIPTDPVVDTGVDVAAADPVVVVRHERGHVVPRLTGEALERVRAFLTRRLRLKMRRGLRGSVQQTQNKSSAAL